MGEKLYRTDFPKLSNTIVCTLMVVGYEVVVLLQFEFEFVFV